MKIVGIIGAAIVSLLLGAVVFHDLWSWFVVPLGAAPIGYRHAFGLRLMIGWLVLDPTRERKEKIGDNAQISMLFSMMIIWGIAWLVSP